jgi:DNA-binding NarL/FixJ family response regulator
MAVRVALADDAFLALAALVSLLDAAPEVDLVAVCHDGDELREAVRHHEPDVVVTDLRMPPSMTDEGLRVAMELRKTHPDIGVILLSAYSEPQYALALMETGSHGRGYLLKEGVHSGRQLISTIESVARGGSAVDPKIIEPVVRRDRGGGPRSLGVLNARELEILARMAAGASNAAIADGLGLTKRSVEKEVSSIFAKLDLAATPDVSHRVHAVLRFLVETGAMPESADPGNGPRSPSRRRRRGTAASP